MVSTIHTVVATAGDIVETNKAGRESIERELIELLLAIITHAQEQAKQIMNLRSDLRCLEKLVAGRIVAPGRIFTAEASEVRGGKQ